MCHTFYFAYILGFVRHLLNTRGGAPAYHRILFTICKLAETNMSLRMDALSMRSSVNMVGRRETDFHPFKNQQRPPESGASPKYRRHQVVENYTVTPLTYEYSSHPLYSLLPSLHHGSYTDASAVTDYAPVTSRNASAIVATCCSVVNSNFVPSNLPR